MPPRFRAPTAEARLWTPLSEEEKADERDTQYLTVIGRLAEDTPIELAAELMAAVQERLAAEYPDSQGDVGSRLEGLLDSIVGNVRSTIWFLFGSVGLVLLIASVNITNMLAVMGLSRQRELAVKAALGAGTGRLARGLLAESAVLAGLGGLAGILLAAASMPLLLRFVPPSVPRFEEIGMDATVILFAIGITAITALVVGILPALQAARAQPQDMIRAAARGTAGDRAGNRLRAGLVVTEVALAFVLLVGAGLLGSSFMRLWGNDRGFATEGLIEMTAYPDAEIYPEKEDRDRFLSLLREKLEAIPGAVVTATNQVPLTGSMSTTSYAAERAEGDPEDVNVVISVILENYLDVMSIPLIEGRSFSAADTRDAPLVAIVNQSMAQTLWPGASPLGKRVRSGAEAEWTTIVGTAGNVRHQGLDVEVEPKLYVPAQQNRRYPSHWVIRPGVTP
jgi:predicted permease